MFFNDLGDHYTRINGIWNDLCNLSYLMWHQIILKIGIFNDMRVQNAIINHNLGSFRILK